MRPAGSLPALFARPDRLVLESPRAFFRRGTAMLTLDHVALAVENLDAVLSRFGDLGLPLGRPEEHETENTREVYVEISPVSILLMQPRSASGPIARHLQRRGAGFHHLGFRTPDATPLLDGLKGWYVCPSTIRNLKRRGPAWLVRPDMGLLLEIVSVDRDIVPTGPDVFRRFCVEAPSVERCRSLLEGIGAFDEKKVSLRQGGGRIRHVELEVGGRRFVLDASGAITSPAPSP